jgi:hypothetical protein
MNFASGRGACPHAQIIRDSAAEDRRLYTVSLLPLPLA